MTTYFLWYVQEKWQAGAKWVQTRPEEGGQVEQVEEEDFKVADWWTPPSGTKQK